MHTQHPTGELDDSSSFQNNLNKPEVMFNKENKALHNPGQLQGPEFRKSKRAPTEDGELLASAAERDGWMPQTSS